MTSFIAMYLPQYPRGESKIHWVDDYHGKLIRVVYAILAITTVDVPGVELLTTGT